MAIEIERKFLVKDKTALDFSTFSNIQQSYFIKNDDFSVRVRILDDIGFITIKKRINSIEKFEFEYQIPISDATTLINLSSAQIIEKTRYRIHEGSQLWEVDVFKGRNTGLIVAEIELTSISQKFKKPQWLGKEVTNSRKYGNSELSIRPFDTW